MAKRDVELTIRAKTQAANSVNDVAAALDHLDKAQALAVASAGKTATALDKLSNELKRLDAEAKGLSALQKVNEQFDKAAGAVNRLEAELAQTQGTFDRLKTEQSQLATQTAKLNTALEKQNAAIESTKIKIGAAQERLAAAKGVIGDLRGSVDTLSASYKKVGDLAGPQLINTLNQQKAALAGAVREQENASKQIDRQTATLAKQEQIAKDLPKQIAASANAERQLGEAAEKAGDAVQRQGQQLQVAKTELAEIGALGDKVSQALGGVAKSHDAVATAAKNAALATKQVTTALDAQKNIRTPAGVAQTTQGPAAAATAAFRAQKAEVQAAAVTLKVYESEVARLANEMKAAATPSAALTRQFNLAVVAAQQGKAAYTAQVAGLNQLKTAANAAAATMRQNVANAQAAAAAQRQAATSSQTLGGALRQIISAFAASGNAASAAGGKIGTFGQNVKAVGDGSRQALSLIQRLRGELLSLTAGYVGLYSAINNIGGVIDSYRALEAAQNKLGAVFGQNETKVNQQIDFLRQNAARLGIDFGVLADEYGKFVIAADASNFSLEASRKIFLATAEAARVNKLSIDDTRGVFLALQQMISKGKVSSEELRRQLGDRLPGAFNIFAKAIGVSTAELDKMMRAGDVLADQSTLLKFADELNSRFGGQLPKSLESVTTAIGRFQNNVTQAQLQFAQGGFIEGLRASLGELDKFFKSKEGHDFFLSLGAAAGQLLKLLAQVPQYFNAIGTAIKLVIAYKLAQIFVGIGQSVVQMNANLALGSRGLFTFSGNINALGARMAALRAGAAGIVASMSGIAGSVSTIGVKAAAASAGVGLLRGAFVAVAGGARLLIGALGGIPGIIATILSFAVTEWFSGFVGAVDSATGALDEHKRIIDEVAAAYGLATGKSIDFQKEVKNVSQLQAENNLKNQIELLDKSLGALKVKAQQTTVQLLSLFSSDQERQVAKLSQAYEKGEISVKELREKLEALNKVLTDDSAKELARNLLELATATDDQKERTIQAAQVAKEFGDQTKGTADIAAQAKVPLKDLTKAVDDAGKVFQTGAPFIDKYGEAMDKLAEKIPALKEQLDKLKGIDDINKAFKEGADAANTFADFNRLEQRRDQAVLGEQLKSASTSLEASAVVLKKFEGFIATPKFDVNHFRAGFGSDTVTLADGSVHEITQGMQVSVQDANRDLIRRIGEFQSKIVAQITPERFAAFSKEQQAALTSIAYNFGHLPDSLAAVINRGGSVQDIAEAIRGLKGLNNGVNDKRRETEAGIFESGGNQADQTTLDAKLAKEKEITAEKAKQAEQTEKDQAAAEADIQKRIEEGNFEVSQLQETARQQAINKALREAELAAQEKGVQLTAQQRDQIEQNAAALFDAANKEKEGSAEREAAEQRVNDLLALRKELQEQITFAQEQGDSGKADALKVKLEETNTQLKEAIANAQQFYANMSGPQADLAKAKLDGVANSLVTVKENMISASEINQQLVSGLTTFFDSAAQSIAGMIDGTLSLKEGLKGIRDAFLKFAADFLKQMGEMLIKQALFNALGGGGQGQTGGVGGFLSNIFGGLFKTGGVSQRPKHSMAMNPAWFANAPHLKNGGVTAMPPGGIAAVLHKNEEVLSEEDPRNVLNGGLSAGGGGGGSPDKWKIINAFDGTDFLNQALSSTEGEKILMNFVRSNRGSFNAALQG